MVAFITVQKVPICAVSIFRFLRSNTRINTRVHSESDESAKKYAIMIKPQELFSAVTDSQKRNDFFNTSILLS